MPNHVTSKIRVAGEPKELWKFVQEILKPDECSDIGFDFNDITPEPEELKDVHAGSCCIDGKRVANWREVDGENVLIPEEELQEWRDKFGVTNLYDWHLKHWDTKWNAYDVSNHITPITSDDEEQEFKFQTAWSFPTPIFEKLSKRYPGLTFKVVCFDEGWNFAGRGEFKGAYSDFKTFEPNEEIYEEVYGYKATKELIEEKELGRKGASMNNPEEVGIRHIGQYVHVSNVHERAAKNNKKCVLLDIVDDKYVVENVNGVKTRWKYAMLANPMPDDQYVTSNFGDIQAWKYASVEAEPKYVDVNLSMNTKGTLATVHCPYCATTHKLSSVLEDPHALGFVWGDMYDKNNSVKIDSIWCKYAGTDGHPYHGWLEGRPKVFPKAIRFRADNRGGRR